MLKDKQGRTLHRRVEIKTLFPSGRVKRQVFRAGPKQGFHDGGIDQILEQCAADLEKRFPQFEFRLVPRGPAAFSFIYHGLKGESK